MGNEIVKELVKEVKRVVGDNYNVEEKIVTKNNDTKLYAVVISEEGKGVSPVIYVDEYLNKISDGVMTLLEGAKEILTIFESAKPSTCPSGQDFLNKEFILSYVEYQLINLALNKDLLEATPHKEFLDLAVVYRVFVNFGEESGSFLMDNRTLENLKISETEIDKAAKVNTLKAGFVKTSMYEMIKGVPLSMEAEESPEQEMFVLTNIRKLYGSNILLYPNELKDVADRINDDLYILPSSVHELITVPASFGSCEDLKKTVRNVNDTVLVSDEILSYSVYRYSRKVGSIEIAV
jgi:hypothetical protein